MLGRRGRRLFDGTPEGSGGAHDGPGKPANTVPSTLMATCPRCGDVVVDVVGTRVRRMPDPAVCRYGFVCPACHRDVEVTAQAHLAAVLLCLGATEDAAVEPIDELTEAHEGPPITLDDVLDLMLALEHHDGTP